MNLVELILFILPAYIANAAPVILGGKTPIDLGQQLPDKKRVFGQGKTIRGFIAGVAAGTITGAILALTIFQFLTNFAFGDKILASFLLSLGAMTGDLLGSFVKRRRGIESGQESKLTDKLWFLVGALAFAFPVYNEKLTIELIDLILLAVLTFFLHICFNRLAHSLKLKKVPW